MNPERLLEHFDRLSEAPDAIPRLRRFILDLAVRGKLMEQDPNDEPGVELLQLVQKGAAIHTDPAGWISGAFGSLLEMQYGKGLPAKDRKEQGEVPVFGSNGIVGYTDAPLTDKPAIIVGRKGSAGALNLCDGPSWTTDVAYFLVPPDYFNIRFLHFTLETLDLGVLGKGVKPGLSRSDTYHLPLAVPPLAEQYRIVAKVDELMALCDQLEAAKTKREQSRDRLVAASLHHLNPPADAEAANTPEALRDHARFASQYLPHLTTRPVHIKQLRQTILNLAVRGKLVPQDPNDEPATQLLKRIQEEKARLLREGRIKEKTPAPGVQESEEPYQVPSSWAWIRFAELIHHSDAGLSPKTEGFPRSGNHWGVLKVSAVSWEDFKPEENKQLLSGPTPPESVHVRAGDFLISRANTSELVAKCVIVESQPDRLILSDKIVRLHITEHCDRRFLRFVNNHADYARGYYVSEASGTSQSMKNVSRPVIYGLPIPLPPLAEQHRIVAKVDELMALCDRLEAVLTTTETDSRRLLEAVLHEALNPPLEAAKQ